MKARKSRSHTRLFVFTCLLKALKVFSVMSYMTIADQKKNLRTSTQINALNKRFGVYSADVENVGNESFILGTKRN